MHYVMQCPETETYAEDICDAAEFELQNLGCTQLLVDAANKHFAGVVCPRQHHPSSHCAARWPILAAWRWLVRIPAKEAVFNALLTSDTADTSDVASPMDLAYRCVMPSPLRYAIQKVARP